MAMYRCEECDQLIDGDYFPCVEHPTIPEAFCCEECAANLEEEVEMQKEFKRMRSANQREVESGLRRK